MQGFLQFQTTLAYLKDPPPAYMQPAVDLLGGLDAISTKAAAGQYQNEYDFELDIFNLLFSAQDGHLLYEPYLIGGFTFSRNVGLVSISADGIQLPKAYFYCKSHAPDCGLAREEPASAN